MIRAIALSSTWDGSLAQLLRRRPLTRWLAEPSSRLVGELVILEPLEPAHAEGLWSTCRDPHVSEYFPIDFYRSRELFARWVAERLTASASGRSASFAVLDATTSEVVGHTAYIEMWPEHRRVEAGMSWLRPELWGSKANLESKLLLIDHAIKKMGCLRVEFETDARNLRARTVLARIGARYEGTFRHHKIIRGGVVRDSAWFSVLAEDWPAIKSSLQIRLSSSLATPRD